MRFHLHVRQEPYTLDYCPPPIIFITISCKFHLQVLPFVNLITFLNFINITNKPTKHLFPLFTMKRARTGKDVIKKGKRAKKTANTSAEMTMVSIPKSSSYLHGWMGPAAQELKYCDTFVTSTTISNSPITQGVYLMTIPRGVGPTDREGNKINVKSCQMRVNVYTDAVSTAPSFFRWALVLDKQPNGVATVPTNQDVFSNPLAATFTTVETTNLDNRNRFYILYDQHGVVGGNGNDACGKVFDLFKKLNLDTTYKTGAGTGVMGDTSTNVLYFYIWCKNVAVTGPPTYSNVKYDMSSRVRYVDS